METPPEKAKTPRKRRTSGRLSPKLQRIRAAKMLEQKILHNKNNQQLAQEFGVAPQHVSKVLALAEKAEIVVKFEDKLYSELLPLASEAVAGALRGDGEVSRAKIALSVMQGTGVLRPRTSTSLAQNAEDDELAVYVLKKRKQAEIDRRTIDADYTNSPSIEGQGPGNLLLRLKPQEAIEEGSAADRQDGPEIIETED